MSARADFYSRIARHHLTPLWEVLHALVPPTPAPRCAPALWRYEEIRPFVLESGDVISAAEAVRRVLVLENPACRGESRITNTLYAGLQLILPGEVAPAHRHTQSAMRFVIEGEGAYTTVDGEKAVMRAGDLILTPSWTWHDHGNDAQGPMVWLDCLDIPLVRYLDAGFAETLGTQSQPQTRAPGDSLARYGANLLPVDHVLRTRTSAVFSYPYDRTREALERLVRAGPLDPSHGLRMKYANPATGDHAVPTIAAFVQWMPRGFRGEAYRSTDGIVFVGVEGRGRTRIEARTGVAAVSAEDVVFEWGPHDVFVIPSWIPYRHEVLEGDAVLFSYSDRAVQEKLDLWREQRG